MKGTVKVLLLASLLISTVLIFGAGCKGNEKDTGADIRIEDVSLGGIGIEGRPISGLPSDKITLLLDVSADEIKVGYNDNGVKPTVDPSGATIEIKEGGISIKGVEPEQLRIEWGNE